MTDYVLTDGMGTAIRQSDSLQEGYVDLDLDELAETYPSVQDADKLIVQRGAAVPRTATVAVLLAGVTLEDVDWLNKAYLY